VGRSLRLSLIVTVIAASTALPRGAHAAATKSDTLVNQGVELRRNGDDQGALALLQQAYALDHAPRAAGQLGLCEQALGRWADAELYITESLKAEADAWVKKNRRTLEDALVIVKSHIARVEVEGEPGGAEIWVNGVLAGKLPLAAPVRVSAGEIEIELRAPGFVRETKTMRLEAGQYQRIVLRASKQVASPPAAPPSAAPAPPPAASTTTVVVNLEDQRRETQPSPAAPPAAASGGRLALKWVAWGLGAAGLGIGIYGTAENASLVSAFNATCAINMGQPVDKATGTPSMTCATKKSDYESKAHLGVAGFIAGGVLVATGFVLWVTEPAARASDHAALSCLPTVTDRLGPAVGCLMHF
jgi:hypothetical protein